jgi:solute carrier family 25 carnitine/acylcarnitine transporter 20/29
VISFWAYELSKRHFHFQDGEQQAALKVLLCGGLAVVITCASIFPLDVIKTRIQAHSNLLMPGESRSLLAPNQILTSNLERQPGAIEIAKQAYREGGIRVFFRGLGVCSVRAFIVNAVQVSWRMMW